MARPAVGFADLKERLEARMKWLGIKVRPARAQGLLCAGACAAAQAAPFSSGPCLERAP